MATFLADNVLAADKVPQNLQQGAAENYTLQMEALNRDTSAAAANINNSATKCGGTALTSNTNKRKLERLKSTASIDELSNSELELKANLYYHISNPLKRWKTDRSPPVTLILQLAKMFCVVTQVIFFMSSNVHQQSNIISDTRNMFSCLFLKQCDPDPKTSSYNAYGINDVRNILITSCSQFSTFMNKTVYGFDCARTEQGGVQPVVVTLTQYSTFDVSSKPYLIDETYKTLSFKMDPLGDIVGQYNNYSEDSLFRRLVSMDMTFKLSRIQVMQSAVIQCYMVTVIIHLKTEGSGMVEYSLNVQHSCVDCDPRSTVKHRKTDSVAAKTVLDVIVISMCLASLANAVIHTASSISLAKALGMFYRTKLGINLSWKDQFPIFSKSHIISFCNDLLTITGTLIKILLDHDSCLLTPSASTQTSLVRILLGVGILLQAAVILRFVSYYKTFNAVYRALSISLPRLAKYILCALILFLAFMIAGWLVLSPFHKKFTNLGESFHVLYTMMHGDDLYNTYEGITMSDDSNAYIFSQFFFTLYLMLFIYAILNLTIAIIMESFEESQNQDTALKNEVRRFVFSGPLTPEGIALRDVTSVNKYVDPDVVKRRQKTEENISSQ